MGSGNLNQWVERIRSAGERVLTRARTWRTPRPPALAASSAETASAFLPTATGFFQLGQRRQLAHLRQQLVQGETEIESLAGTLEQRFLTIGGQLDQISGASDRLLASSDRLAQLAVGEHQNTSVLATASHALQTALQQLHTQQHAAEAFSRTLVQHLDEITQARRHELSLRSSVAPLKPIQTLFRVSAAALAVDAQSTYTSLAQEIDQLNEQVSTLLSQQFQSLTDYHTRIRQLVRRINETNQSQQRAVADDTEQLTRSLAGLRSALAASQGRDVRLNLAARACHEQVGDLVMAMQFQDITRQKLEHIETALRRLAESLGDRALDETTAADMHATASVQLAQLDTVEDELEAAETKMKQAVNGLCERVTALTIEGQQLRQLPTLIATDNGVVPQLLGSVGRLRRLVESNATLQSEAHQALDPLAGLASNLTGAMRDVSLRIKFIALNAQIQAVQIGKGTGLEVLSQHTCHISDQVAQLSEKAAVELDALIASFTALVATCRELHQQASEQQTWLDSEGAGLQGQLAAFHSAGATQLDAVASIGAELHGQLEVARRELGFYEAAVPSFTTLREPLAALAELTAHARHLGHPVGGLTEELQSHYTMASEHSALATALGTAAVTTTTASANNQAVELF